MRDGLKTTREDLRERYGIDAEFVRVKQLSKVTGLAAATIYTQIRHGAFPMPVRRLGEMPLVKVDHLLEWLNGSGEGGRIVVRADAPSARGEGHKPVVEPADPLDAAIERAIKAVENAKARRRSKTEARRLPSCQVGAETGASGSGFGRQCGRRA